MNLPMNESQFTDAVIELAQYRGWRVAHFRPARTVKGWRTPVQGNKGFPDLVLARRGQVVFAELKTTKGTVQAEQKKWIEELPDVHVWRPADLLQIIPEVLR
jgi:hypothetical protein